MTRTRGKFDHEFYKAVIGCANDYKEGDESLGISAATPATRENARTLIANTRIGELVDRPMHSDAVYDLILQTTDKSALERVRGWKMSELQDLPADEERRRDQGRDGGAAQRRDRHRGQADEQ